MKINLEIISSAHLKAPIAVEGLNTKTLVPKMVFRRRLTRASKLAIELLNLVGFGKGRIIYGSAYGELPATASILNSILNKSGISPTDFQNSVYNTPVSYASILEKNESEMLTISSGDETSDKLLKIGAIKALDGDEILLIASETMNIENIDEVNSCIKYLESAVALRVKVTDEESTLHIKDIDDSLPKSLAKLVAISESCKENQKNIIEIQI
ncbi:MAG: hypothetical protein C0625_11355 [Arcobacter sp.]|nr:MAG: hypothetical protein C0625_11355 [Arcobacter sp.]